MTASRAIVLCILIGLVGAAAQTPVPTFRLYFLGHEVGAESIVTPGSYELRFVERGTEVKLTGSLELAADGSASSLTVRGKNYRLFASDSEVRIAGGHAREHEPAGGVGLCFQFARDRLRQRIQRKQKPTGDVYGNL